MIGRIAGEALRVARRSAAVATGTSIEVLKRINERLLDQGDGEVDDEVLGDLRGLLGLGSAPGPTTSEPDELPAADTPTAPDRLSEAELRGRFRDLLERSRAPTPEEGTHPALRHIVDELSPDEARILRVLRESGPVPVVSVCATPLIGRGDETLLEHATLLGDRAGCHRPDDAPAYLDNLRRLGLIRIVEEEMTGSEDYDVIESRTDVQQVCERIRAQRGQRVRTVRGTVRLSRLGELLCEICLA